MGGASHHPWVMGHTHFTIHTPTSVLFPTAAVSWISDCNPKDHLLAKKGIVLSALFMRMSNTNEQVQDLSIQAD